MQRNGWDRIHAIVTGCLKEYLEFPNAASGHDPDLPFSMTATLGAWEVQTTAGSLETVHITLASGRMHDIDKGDFAIEGVIVVLRLEGETIVPIEVLNPGNLSELQQAGLLNAVVTHLAAVGTIEKSNQKR